METSPTTIQTPKKKLFSRPIVRSIVGILLIALIVGGILVYKAMTTRISIDMSTISAPVITISPLAPGVLDKVYVHNGDTVSAGQALAQVGSEILSAKINGVVIEVNNTPGQIFNSAQPVIKMIDPRELRVIGSIKENEGLSNIKVGDPVSFTVDAFEGQNYTGIVEEISPSSRESGLAFSISDKREIKEFDIKVKYNNSDHPEFKNGMSAKMKVFRK